MVNNIIFVDHENHHPQVNERDNRTNKNIQHLKPFLLHFSCTKVSSPPALETLSFQGDFAAPRRLKLPILDVVDYRLMALEKLFFLTVEFLNYLQ
jgi:hypothetical protein